MDRDGLAEARGMRLGEGEIEIPDSDGGAALGEMGGDSAADALRSAGDDGDAAGKVVRIQVMSPAGTLSGDGRVSHGRGDVKRQSGLRPRSGRATSDA